MSTAKCIYCGGLGFCTYTLQDKFVFIIDSHYNFGRWDEAVAEIWDLYSAKTWMKFVDRWLSELSVDAI